MPHPFEKEGKLIPTHLKRSAKLTDKQRAEIRENVDGLSQRALAKRYGVSRRLITFILNPEKLAENKKRRAERGGSTIYYDRETHTKAMRDHRRYKKRLDQAKLLEDKYAS
jgi:transposase